MRSFILPLIFAIAATVVAFFYEIEQKAEKTRERALVTLRQHHFGPDFQSRLDIALQKSPDTELQYEMKGGVWQSEVQISLEVHSKEGDQTYHFTVDPPEITASDPQTSLLIEKLSHLKGEQDVR